MNRDSVWIDVIALWVFTMGVWPLADPGHDADSLLSLLDLLLHGAAAVVLLCRWQVVRRGSGQPGRHVDAGADR